MLNSRLGLFTAATSLWLPFSLSYGVILPSSLTTLLPLALEFSSHLPVSVCGTGASSIHIPFLATTFSHFPTKFQSLSPGATNARVQLFAFADARLPLIELKTTTASLEQVFLSLTQEDAPQATESTLDDAASDPDAEPVQATQEEEEDS